MGSPTDDEITATVGHQVYAFGGRILDRKGRRTAEREQSPDLAALPEAVQAAIRS